MYLVLGSKKTSRCSRDRRADWLATRFPPGSLAAAFCAVFTGGLVADFFGGRALACDFVDRPSGEVAAKRVPSSARARAWTWSSSGAKTMVALPSGVMR